MADGTSTATITLSSAPERLHHHWEACIGSGHATLALRADWQAQLARCHRDLGCQRVRFHGILSDDVGTYVVEGGKAIDSFLNTDRIWDAVVAMGMSPLVELSFMPKALASGDKTVFSYRGNVTPPADYSSWASLMGRLCAHWHERYGQQELERWRFEIWNEPNLPSFWTGTRADYFKLYEKSVRAIKTVDCRLQVGGPATAKNAWLEEFIAHCVQHHVPIDFISTHHYPTDAFGNEASDIDEQLAKSPRDALRDQAQAARAIVGGLPLWYTEWNMTSSPHDPLHDQPIAAAYAVHAIMGVRGLVDGYSHWTFSDIFAENYFPSRPFHGGFGLLTLHGIPKPIYRAFAMLHRFGDELWAVPTGHPTMEAWVIRGGDTLMVLIANAVLPKQIATSGVLDLTIVEATQPRSCVIERIDDDHANPRRRWIDLGSPEYLSDAQVADLEGCAATAAAVHPVAFDHGCISVSVAIPANGVALITLVCDPVTAALPPANIAAVNSRAARITTASSANADDRFLDRNQQEAFAYFKFHCDLDTGMIPDNSHHASPISISAVGFALATGPVAVERGFLSRAEALRRTLTALRFLCRCEEGEHARASCHRGFFYHFLDRKTGRRTLDSELSTIDTALLVAGALIAAAYFDGDTAAEREVREMTDALYRRVEWSWALADGDLLRLGWHPVSGFLNAKWHGYSEALLLHVLAAGSSTHPIAPANYQAFTDTFAWKKIGDISYLHAGPLFIHQYAHCFLDLRGIADAFMREHHCDYFENSRRAVLVQQRYASDNPQNFKGYGTHCWGLTASDGPGQTVLAIDGVDREFFGYRARGVAGGPDDGTITPSATLASMPFAPDIVMPTMAHLHGLGLAPGPRHGSLPTFNLTYPGGWVVGKHFAINEGPPVLLLENHRSGLLWRLMRKQPAMRHGLQRCGFTGGYLAE